MIRTLRSAARRPNWRSLRWPPRDLRRLAPVARPQSLLGLRRRWPPRSRQKSAACRRAPPHGPIENSIRGREHLIWPRRPAKSSSDCTVPNVRRSLGFFGSRLRGRRDHLQVTSHRRNLALNGHRHILGAPGVVCRLARQIANIRRHDRKAATEFACARGFHRPADRQHVRLHGDQRDAVDDLLDAPAGRLQCCQHLADSERLCHGCRRYGSRRASATATRLAATFGESSPIRSPACAAAVANRHRGVFDLRHRCARLLRRRRLRLGAEPDLIDGREDLAGGARQLLNRGREFLGGGCQLL